MLKVIIASHCSMAAGMKSSLEKILGDLPHVIPINAYVDERSVEALFREAMEQVEADDVLVLCTDLFGGSVNQQLLEWVDMERTYLFAGVNLPFLLALLMMQPEDVDEGRLREVMAAAREQLVYVKDCLDQEVEDDF